MRILLAPLLIALTPATMTQAAPDLQNLDPETCGQYLVIHSATGDTALPDVTFQNSTSETRTVAWIDYQGAVVHYSTLEPGQTYAVDTYLTHPWLIVDDSGKCRELFIPGFPGENFIIRN